MFKFRHLELSRRGPVSRIRLLSRGHHYCSQDILQLTREWNAVVDDADCRVLVVDCANMAFLNSEMLSKLILLQRRLKLKSGRLVLCGLRAEIREILHWTKLDRYLEITDDEREEPAAPTPEVVCSYPLELVGILGHRPSCALETDSVVGGAGSSRRAAI